MEIAVAVILLIVSLFLVIKGGDIFVDSATDIAKRAHISQIVFGATVVSLCTTLPELLISIFSATDNVTGLAVGNAVGSAICNIGLILGILFVTNSADMKNGGKLKYYLYLAVVCVLVVFSCFYELKIWQAIILLVFGISFFAINYIDIKLTKKRKTKSKQSEEKLRPLWQTILMFILGTAAIGGGAYLLVEQVEYLSKVIGVSEQFVGLTVIAIGTSLPELVTALNSIKNKTPYLAIGNIIGSNILNLTLILSTARLIDFDNKMLVSNETLFITLPILVVMSLILVLPILIKKKTYKFQGILFLILYVLYIAYLICNAIFKFI